MIRFFIGFRCLMWVKRNNSLFSFLYWLNFFLNFLIFQIFTCMNSLVVDLNRNIKIITINWLDYLTRTFTKLILISWKNCLIKTAKNDINIEVINSYLKTKIESDCWWILCSNIFYFLTKKILLKLSWI